MNKLVCPYNGNLDGCDELIICDTTLREGEQTPGVAFTDAEKLEIARKLDKVGVAQIQIANIGLSERLKKLAKDICALGLKAKTEVMSSLMRPDWEKTIDFLLECDPDVIHASCAISSHLYPDWSEAKKDEIRGNVAKAARYVKSTGKVCNISFADAPRADMELLRELTTIAVENGADRIRLADTVGIASPEGMTRIVKAAVGIAHPAGAIVGVHCHNDFGLGLANTLASIKAGARLADVCVNGIGDRCGNAALEQLVVALEALYSGSLQGYDISELTSLSRLVETLSGVPVAGSQPLVGKYAFSADTDDHIELQDAYEFAFQGIIPEDIGAKRVTMYGKHSGAAAIRHAAKAARADIPERLYPAIREQLRAMDEAAKGRPLFEEDFLKAARLAGAAI